MKFTLTFIIVIVSAVAAPMPEKIELSAKAHGKITTLANALVDSGEIAFDSSIKEIDASLFEAFPDTYGPFCALVLNGPSVLAFEDPDRHGGTSLVAFTENVTQSGENASDGGRYVYYWDEEYLRSSYFEESAFRAMVDNYNFDISLAAPFLFEGLVASIEKTEGKLPKRDPKSAPSLFLSTNEDETENSAFDLGASDSSKETRKEAPMEDEIEERGNRTIVLVSLLGVAFVGLALVVIILGKRRKIG